MVKNDYLLIFLIVCSQSSYFRNIMLRTPVSVRNTNIRIDTVSFRTDLALAYESFGYNSSLINKICNFYECVSYIQDIHNAEIQCHLSTGDIVTIQVADYGESYAVVKGIFKHKVMMDIYTRSFTSIGLRIPAKIITHWNVQSLSFGMMIFIARFFC